MKLRIAKKVAQNVSPEELRLVLDESTLAEINSTEKESKIEAIPLYDQIRKTQQKEWNSIQPFLAVNSQLNEIPDGRYGRNKNSLEGQIETALQQGNVQLAEKLSDALTEQQATKKIEKAKEARNYAHQLTELQRQRNERKKPKLVWGFATKAKWETKGNM